jgi:hypothetical protein
LVSLDPETLDTFVLLVRTGIKSFVPDVFRDPLRVTVPVLVDIGVFEEVPTVLAGLNPISFTEPDLDEVILELRDLRTVEPSRLNGLGLKRSP